MDAAPASPRPGSPEEEAQLRQQHQALSGVNPGGAGYNSGQVNPSAGQVQTQVPHRLGRAASALWDSTLASAKAPTQTNTSALTLPRVGPSSASKGGLSGYAAPGTTNVNASGTTHSGIANAGDLPLVGGIPGASSIPILGGALSTPTADLSGIHAAQNADFQQGQNLAQERYDYRPGDAPYQERVQLDTTQADQTRAQQQQAIQALQDAAAGRTPSAAEIQLRSQADRNNANSFGQAAALRGRSPGSSFLQASRQNAANQIDTNSSAAALRANEMANARNALTGALSGVRGQDTDIAQGNAGLAQGANQNNLNAQLQTNAQNQDWRQSLLQGQLAAMGYGTQAAGAGATASAANAKAEGDKQKDIINAAASFVGL